MTILDYQSLSSPLPLHRPRLACVGCLLLAAAFATSPVAAVVRKFFPFHFFFVYQFDAIEIMQFGVVCVRMILMTMGVSCLVRADVTRWLSPGTSLWTRRLMLNVVLFCTLLTLARALGFFIAMATLPSSFVWDWVKYSRFSHHLHFAVQCAWPLAYVFGLVYVIQVSRAVRKPRLGVFAGVLFSSVLAVSAWDIFVDVSRIAGWNFLFYPASIMSVVYRVMYYTTFLLVPLQAFFFLIVGLRLLLVARAARR